MANHDLSRLKIERSAPAAAAPAWRGRRLAAALLAVAALALFYAYGMNREIEVEPVTVTASYPTQALTLLNAAGYVVAQRKAAVASKATGRLEWLGVAEGSRAKAGEVIARLESRDVTATMEQAAANVRVAQANAMQAQAEAQDAESAFGRAQSLAARGFLSQAALDAAAARHHKAQGALASAQAGIAAAQAALAAARVAVEQTLIRAPFDGVVLSKSANVGDVVSPFTTALDAKGAVVSMADMQTLEVEADVSESNLQKVQPDQPCEILLDALPEARLRGKVHRIVPTVDRSKATVLVKIRFLDEDARILPEMSAKVAFLSQPAPAENRPHTVVPPAAIATRNGRSVVFLIEGEKTKEIAIETGGKIGDMTEVRNGVKPGDKIVLAPPAQLRDGAAIRLKK